MKIALGIEGSRTTEDIEKLVRAGADEFFCGILTDDWAKTYGYALSINKRFDPGTQFATFENLKKITDKIHSLGKKIFITFNAHDYTNDQLPLLRQCLECTSELKPDAVIVTDMALLVLLKIWNLGLKIHIGGDAGSYNYRSVSFFKKLGVNRIKFPRDMTTDEMAKVIEKSKDLGMEYEAFIMDQRCPFSGVGCRSSHAFGPRDFCYQSWRKILISRLPSHTSVYSSSIADEGNIPKISVAAARAWNENSALYKMWTAGGSFAMSKPRDNILRECGLCAIPKLKSIGVDSLKVVARGKSLPGKLMQLELIKRVIDNENADSGYCMRLRDNFSICKLGYNCYYPETRGILEKEN
ncbi:MAG: Peptidase family U32 [Elusimicrobia bacterium ADurb.Bin231]|nr:MAG: Peptidase family U32 [Elusimicrobia bacterium ADurb.Bin231]